MKAFFLVAAVILATGCRTGKVLGRDSIPVGPMQADRVRTDPGAQLAVAEKTSALVATTSTPIQPSAPIVNLQGIGVVIDEINNQLKDVFFQYDRSVLEEEAMAILEHNATAVKPAFLQFPSLRLIVEGHCDERGSAEYNLGLGDLRAEKAREILGGLGLPAERIIVISYGKEAPQCTEPFDSCWASNRRAHFVLQNRGE